MFADYSSMEVRLLSYYMAVALGDYTLAEELRAGLDPHRLTASTIFGKAPEDITDIERNKGKVCLFSIIYGGGAATLIKQGVCKTRKEAYQLLNAFHSARPGIGELDEFVKYTLNSRGYIFTLWGRELVPLEYKALNALIQGSGSDMLKDAIINTCEWLDTINFQSHPVLNIHDELGLDCMEQDKDQIIQMLPILMRNEQVHAIVPVEVDIATGRRWSEKKGV